MKTRKVLITVLAGLFLGGCRPKPIDIAIPQESPKLVVSATCINDSTVLVCAGYSITSLQNLEDTVANKQPLKDLLTDSALVTITREGQITDTLKRTAVGIYGSTKMHFEPGMKYTLTVIDRIKTAVATASTVYQPQASVESITPEVIRRNTDTLIRLHVRLKNVFLGSRFFIGYNTMAQTRASVALKIATLQSFSPKRMELFDGSDCQNGIVEKVISLRAGANDTLVVHLGNIDDAYYKYLSAYKRTGYLLNQLTNEPINLPTNLSQGFGYFALYQPVRSVFDLKKY